MKYDYILGLDSGYATLGITVLDMRNIYPEFIHMSSALTTKTIAGGRIKGEKFSINNHLEREETFERIRLIVNYVRGVIRSVCKPIFKLKALVVMEDWIAAPRVRYVKTIYYRGAVDAALRIMLQMHGAHILGVDPIWVNQFSNGQGKKTMGPENPTPMEILLYIKMACPWLKNFDVQQWIEHRGTAVMLNGSNKKKRLPEAAKLHYADGAVMATMGVLAIDASLAAGRPPNQIEKTSYLWERWQEVCKNDFQQQQSNPGSS